VDVRLRRHEGTAGSRGAAQVCDGGGRQARCPDSAAGRERRLAAEPRHGDGVYRQGDAADHS